MIFDSHVHSRMSTDSNMDPETAVDFARNRRMGLVFTEHYDADYIENDYDFRVNAKAYLNSYNKYRDDDILLGIEIGLTHTSIGQNKRIAEAHPFDFVLGTVHMVNGIDIYIDFNRSNYPEIIPEMYFDYMKDMIIKNDFFDALGHIDYPQRYIKNRPIDFSFKTHGKKYDIIFKKLIDRDIPIEVNSRRLSWKGEFDDMFELYKRYYELGGRYVTLGSDSHSLDQIGLNFDIALKLIKDIGLTLVYFRERKMCEIKL